MKSIKEIRSDRRGISTLLIAVIIVIIVVAIVAVAAFVIFSGNGSNNGVTEPPNGGDGIIAPGTTLTAEISSASGTYTYVQNYVGQNANNYFIEETTPAGTDYYLEPKDQANKAPDGAVKIGDDTIDTKDGPKDVEIWQYTSTQSGSSTVTKAYIDPVYKWLVYLGEITNSDGTTTTYTLQDYNVVLQTSYTESNAIGKTYQYSFSTGTYTFPAYVTCIADCLNGQYGMMFDFSSLQSGLVIYDLSDNIQGLPLDANISGGKSDLTGTIDGNVSVQIWKFTEDNEGFSFYYEPKSHVIYEIVLTPSSGTPAVFSLVKKA
ncbi:MAG: hypothetical protein FWF07_01425 [Methanomassiliicoccaceae archaeon]|nr:hypothetical protein [Methanomassiliicoccaceae archaeon]